MRLNRRHADLSAIEFHYVLGLLRQYRKSPINAHVLSEQVEACVYQEVDLKKKIVTADVALLLLGFFDPHGQGFYRKRSSYALWYYGRIARRCYWEVSDTTGKRLYASMSRNFSDWVNALSGLARSLKEQSLARFLVNQETEN